MCISVPMSLCWKDGGSDGMDGRNALGLGGSGFGGMLIVANGCLFRFKEGVGDGGR